MSVKIARFHILDLLPQWSRELFQKEVYDYHSRPDELVNLDVTVLQVIKVDRDTRLVYFYSDAIVRYLDEEEGQYVEGSYNDLEVALIQSNRMRLVVGNWRNGRVQKIGLSNSSKSVILLYERAEPEYILIRDILKK